MNKKEKPGQQRREKTIAQRNRMEAEKLDNNLDEVVMASADLHGNIGKYGYDRSLSRAEDEFDGDGGPGATSEVAVGSDLVDVTGMANEIGMHIEPGFSVGYAADDDTDIGPDEGNEGGYLNLADAAQGRKSTPGDKGTGLQTALGVPDVGKVEVEGENLSIEQVSGGEAGYGAMIADTDTDITDEAQVRP